MPRSANKSKTGQPSRRATAGKGVFFNSLPKSGKNLIYTFFSALGYNRVSIDESFNASIHDVAYAAHSGQVIFSLDRPIETPAAAFSPADAALDALKSLKADQIAQKHLPYCAPVADALEAAGRRSIFVWRDPRDVLVSMLNYARSQSKPEHMAARLAELDDEQALIALLEGRGDLVPFSTYVEGFLGWIGQPGVLTVCFEDLVGPEGGGSTERQRRTFEEICDHFSLSAEPDRIAHAARAAFNRRAGTFYKGRIGAWRDQFTPKVTKAFQKRAGDLLSRWRLWRLDRLESYAADLDDRYAAVEESRRGELARAETSERALAAVAQAVDLDPSALDEPLAKTIAKRIAALDARSTTLQARLEGALASLEAGSRRYKELEQSFTERAEAMNALRADLRKASEAAKIEGQLSAVAEKLGLDRVQPLPAIKQEIDRLRAGLAHAETQLGGWMKHGEALAASKANIEDQLRTLQSEGETARRTLLKRLEQRDGQMAELEAALARSSEIRAEQTKAFEALLKAAKDENRQAHARVEQRNATIGALQERLETAETQRRALAARLSDLAASSSETRTALLRLVEKKETELSLLVEKFNTTRERLIATTQALTEAEAGMKIRRELESVAAKLALDVSGGSTAGALKTAVDQARAQVQASEQENAVLRDRLHEAEDAVSRLDLPLPEDAPEQEETKIAPGDRSVESNADKAEHADAEWPAGGLPARN